MPGLACEPASGDDLDTLVATLEERLRQLDGPTLDEVAGRALFDDLAELPHLALRACGDVDAAAAARLAETGRILLSELGDMVRTAQARSVERINDAFVALSPGVSSGQLIDAAPAMLCSAGDFDRAFISRVRGSRWLPAAIHVARGADDPVNVRLVNAITTLEVPLAGSLVETGMLRRRSAVLVAGDAVEGQPSHVLAALSRSRAYVAAPIVIAGRVAGFLHADTYSTRRTLTAADRVAIQAFADMFDLAYERATVAERLREQRDAIQAALTSAANSVSEIGGTVGVLARTGGQPRATRVPVGPAGRAGDGGTGRLSRREWEILDLLATGASNGQIAATLVLSESTIKSHVKRILRKLPAANRAEAVYRYTQLTGERSRVP